MDLYFDTTTFTDDTVSDAAIPNGKYRAMITNVETLTPKSGGADYISFTIEIVEGKFRGRRIWDSLFVNSPNENAVSIAKRKLNDIANAIGVTVIKGAETVMNKLLAVELIDDRSRPDKKQVKKYVTVKEVSSSGMGNAGVATSTNSEDEIPF